MQLTFGKYKNKDIYETMDLDPNYCKWLYGLDITKEKSPQLFEILDKRFKDDKDFYMPWGKYKGRSLRWIYENDERYLQWLEDNEIVQNKHKYLFSAIMGLKNNL